MLKQPYSKALSVTLVQSGTIGQRDNTEIPENDSGIYVSFIYAAHANTADHGEKRICEEWGWGNWLAICESILNTFTPTMKHQGTVKTLENKRISLRLCLRKYF